MNINSTSEGGSTSEANSASPQKMIWLIIFCSLSVFSVGAYGLLCFLLMQSRKPPTALMLSNVATWRPYVLLVGALALAGAVAWVHIKTKGRIGSSTEITSASRTLLDPAEFQIVTIVGLALTEACALFGLILFFLGGSIQDFAYFAAGTLFVDLFFILPKGMSYWAAWEQHEKSFKGF